MANDLREHAVERVGMHEGDLVPAEAGPRLRVDHVGALLDELADGGPNVVHLERDVVHPWTPLGQEPPHRCVGCQRRDELDPALAEPEVDRVDSMRPLTSTSAPKKRV
jgi:hypothetical protein